MRLDEGPWVAAFLLCQQFVAVEPYAIAGLINEHTPVAYPCELAITCVAVINPGAFTGRIRYRVLQIWQESEDAILADTVRDHRGRQWIWSNSLVIRSGQPGVALLALVAGEGAIAATEVVAVTTVRFLPAIPRTSA